MRWPKLAQVAALPALWLFVAAVMVRDHLTDPFDPQRMATAAYGHNHEGALVQGLAMTLVELVVLGAILRPWSYERSWGRSAVATALLLPWALLSMVLTMHSGGILVIHFFWVAALIAGLAVAAVWGGVEAATRGRLAGPARANARKA